LQVVFQCRACRWNFHLAFSWHQIIVMTYQCN